MKLTGREGCAGLRRENFGIPDIQKVETQTSDKKHKKMYFFDYFLAFFPYIWSLAGPTIAKKGLAVAKIGEGWIDKPILELLTFGSNLDFSDLRMFCACFAYVFV